MRSGSKCRSGRWTVVAVALAWATPGFAETNSSSSRAMARSLGEEGLSALDRGELPKALDYLNRAYQLQPVPSLALWSGRALARMGKLVAASERWYEARHLNVTVGDREIQLQAQQEAAAERAALVSRIPTLLIAVKGGVPEGGSLTIDGIATPNAVIDSPMPIDPGNHEVVLRWGNRSAKAQVHLVETARESVVLSWANLEQAAPSSEHAANLPPERGVNPAKPRSSLQRSLGWVSLGIGAAGLATWGITGAIAINQHGKLDDHCPNGQCPPEYHDDLHRFQSFRTVSTVGFVTGLVGLGAGAVLLLTAPHSTRGSQPAATWHGWISSSGVGILGTY